MAPRTTAVLLEDLCLPAHAAWRDGALWVADTVGGDLLCVDESGAVLRRIAVPGRPGAFGWSADGTLHVVSAGDRRLLAVRGDHTEEVADLWDLSPHDCTGLAFGPNGHAYVANCGFDFTASAEPRSATIVGVDPDGGTWLAATGALLPAELLVPPGSSQLMVVESLGRRITTFEMADDGSLHDPAVWADLQPNVPSGACPDGHHGVWATDPVNKGVMRVIAQVGAVEWISTGDRRAYACALGGEDGNVLFVCTGLTSEPRQAAERRVGRVELAVVDT
ncbi:MAG: SMP-30/gluconolactonase/LRE family protein [Acidimicrobiia bacterium]|nr:SMP-30/gluconolactonase/LRE family protein [Acidimicrobiia bacterium]